MKYVLLAALCFTFAGCANTSNGGGWVVGNGMTDSGTGAMGMQAIKDNGCDCQPGSEGCECEAPRPVPKPKTKVRK